MTQSKRIVSFVTIAAVLVLLPGRMAAQSGSFPVGHATRVLNVPGIHNVSNGGNPEPRPVNVHLWYPAPNPQNCQSGPGNSQGCPPSVFTSRLNGIPLLPQWDPLSWTIRSTLSFEELPVSSARTSYPVIIFSHGNQGNAIDYTYTLEALASSGFIVAAPDHVNDTQDDVRIDFINTQANSTLIPCFDGLAAPCEVLDRVKAQDPNSIDTQVACSNNPLIKTTASVRESMTDRVTDVRAIMDALSTWFGSRADKSRIGVMGHSRGTVTALAAAGGSQCWKIDAADALHPVKAIMGLAIGAQNVTKGVDLGKVAVPTQLMAGSLDPTLCVSQQLVLVHPTLCVNQQLALPTLGSTDKGLVTIQNAKHRHFDSGLCAQTQSSGAIAQANSRAVLDLETATFLIAPPTASLGVAMDYCGYATFTNPINILNLVSSLTLSVTGKEFDVTPTNVPTVPPGATAGLTSDEVQEQVIQRAVAFFSCAFTPNASSCATQ